MAEYPFGQEFQQHSRDPSRARNPDSDRSVYQPPLVQNNLYPFSSQSYSAQMWNNYPSSLQSGGFVSDCTPAYNFSDPQWTPSGTQNSYMAAGSAGYPSLPVTNYTEYNVHNPMSTLTSPFSFDSSAGATTVHSSPDSQSAILSAPHTPSSLSMMPTPPNDSASLPEPSPSPSSRRARTPYRQQYELWVKAMSLPTETFPGPFIPQAIYKPHTNSDRKRYVEEITLDLPLYFAMENPGEYGLPLSDALHSRVKRLVDREKPVFEGRGPSVSIRLEWPGYRQWTRQIPTKDFRSPPGPITMAKLAKNVAKCVQRFIDENKDRVLEDGADVKWKVGTRPYEIKLEDVVLVSLHHVSLGSWQPQLRLRRPQIC